MVERTIFDCYRADAALSRKDHYVLWTPHERQVWSTGELFELVASLAAGFSSLGVGRGDRVLLLCDNRPEWHAVDLAVVSLGAIDVPVYGTLTPQQIAMQARHSGAIAAVVDTAAQMEKVLVARGECPDLAHLVQIEGALEHGVVSLAEVAAAGSSGGAADSFWRGAARARDEDPVTLIYTSGTTGTPKGVVLTHRNLVSNVVAALPRVPIDSSDLALEFLPLCHVLERMLGYAYMARATRRAYCSVLHVGELISEIRPTLFAGVPRFYEKVRDAVLTRATASPVSSLVVGWALPVGKEFSHRRRAGRPVGTALEFQHRAAERLVFSKVREALGGRVRACISGGAPLSLDAAEFFHAAGVPVVEGYGLTETSPVIAVNGLAPGELRLGTVGKPLDNVEIKVADDGELLVRGPSVFGGYWNEPAESREAFDAEGFFRTGDIVEIDDDGFLLVTDRKKEIIVTAGGKNVAPQPIEAELKRGGLVDSAVVVGDQRPYLVALLAPRPDELAVRARALGIASADLEGLVSRPEILALFAQEVERVNAGLARFEQIKRFAVLPLVLSVAEGHLTPTLKVRRKAIEQQFSATIEELYRRAAS